MKRLFFAMLALAFLSPAVASEINTAAKSDQLEMSVKNDALYDARTFQPAMLMADATTSTTTNTDTPAPPSKVTTVVQGGTWAGAILDWIKVALVPILGTGAVAVFLKVLAYLGIQITSQQSSQLQNIAINGLNSAMDKAAASVRANPNLSIDLKNEVIADAVRYTQDHAKETIKAMGLDPQSGQAVEKIRAKILTVINDPTKPTPPAITPKVAGGTA